MKRFANLYYKLKSRSEPKERLEALIKYFTEAPEKDRLWAIALFTNRRPKRSIQIKTLKSWANEFSGVPSWLFEKCYQEVGDLSETINLTLPVHESTADWTLSDCIEQIIKQRDADSEGKKKLIFKIWKNLRQGERFIFNKLITGGFRMSIMIRIPTSVRSS